MVVTARFRRTLLVRKVPGEALEMGLSGPICRFDVYQAR
jgi:hypothetical protein